MQNLEQTRAARALAFWRDNPDANKGEDGGKVVEGLPALIINNGLLATAAYALSKRGGHQQIAGNLLHHVAVVCPAALAFPAGRNQVPRLADSLRQLTEGDSVQLQHATREALVYLGYLKRFAPPRE